MALLMRITTTHAHDCMKNGAMPIPMILRTISHLNRNIPDLKCMKCDGSEKCAIWMHSDTVCASTVAKAEPLMPQPNTKMKSHASTTFTPTEINIIIIDLRG